MASTISYARQGKNERNMGGRLGKKARFSWFQGWGAADARVIRMRGVEPEKEYC